MVAFFGAAAATAFVVSVSFSGRRKSSSVTIVLAGVAISSLLNAGISFLSLRFDDVLSSYTAFSVGGFSGVSFDELAFPAAISAAAFVAAVIISPSLNLLCLGDDTARSLGVRVSFIRIFSLGIACLLCASAVSFAGLIGFVGLIVPHIVRKLAGNDVRKNLFLCAIFGGILVIASDLVGRVIFAPSEIPAGIIMAMLGSPFFLWLLIGRRSGRS